MEEGRSVLLGGGLVAGGFRRLCPDDLVGRDLLEGDAQRLAGDRRNLWRDHVTETLAELVEVRVDVAGPPSGERDQAELGIDTGEQASIEGSSSWSWDWAMAGLLGRHAGWRGWRTWMIAPVVRNGCDNSEIAWQAYRLRSDSMMAAKSSIVCSMSSLTTTWSASARLDRFFELGLAQPGEHLVVFVTPQGEDAVPARRAMAAGRRSRSRRDGDASPAGPRRPRSRAPDRCRLGGRGTARRVRACRSSCRGTRSTEEAAGLDSRFELGRRGEHVRCRARQVADRAVVHDRPARLGIAQYQLIDDRALPTPPDRRRRRSTGHEPSCWRSAARCWVPSPWTRRLSAMPISSITRRLDLADARE